MTMSVLSSTVDEKYNRDYTDSLLGKVGQMSTSSKIHTGR